MSNFTITNGCNIPVNVQTGTIPNMGGALLDYMQLMTFTRITKSVVAFREYETSEDISFWGVMQPLTTRDLVLKPEGQRAWSWYRLIAQASPLGSLLKLNVDEIVLWLGKQTRVMSTQNFSLYSYIEYQLVQDWTGEPPTP